MWYTNTPYKVVQRSHNRSVGRPVNGDIIFPPNHDFIMEGCVKGCLDNRIFNINIILSFYNVDKDTLHLYNIS